MSVHTEQQRRRADQLARSSRRAEIDVLQRQLDEIKQTLRDLESEVTRLTVVFDDVVEAVDAIRENE